MMKKWHHRVQIRKIPRDDHVFLWHFPRGTLEPRMSAYELGLVLLPKMPGVVQFLPDGRIREEFIAILMNLATNPKSVLDEILPWIKPVVRTEESDVIEMCITAKHVDEAPRKISLPCH